MHLLFSSPVILAMADAGDHRVTIFFTQIVLLILVGRLLGEGMQRIGQPAVMGQLLAGIILGPSVFGALWPAAQTMIFPAVSADRQMLSAVSELGVLMLLLLTGMETDLSLVKRVRRTAALVSAAGIIIPFGCGFALGELLPASVLPDPDRRLLTSLFLATALSISSVKIVAAVLREVDFLQRDLGQIILAAAILDDTIGWTILAFIGGLAAQGEILIGPMLISVVGTTVFLVVCLGFGHRWIARVIRWANDRLVIEMPVISVILIIMIVLALMTHFIGVHTVLGAFVAGIMIGQSPILTKHIEEQLRGLIIALFMPVFFGVAGLAIDLKVLADPTLLGLAILLIAIASAGKLGGCYLGSRLARLNRMESLAIGLGMNARGSTEVILATIGLTIGVLNQRLFTIIVVMAVVTTLAMPPLLRWALARVPLRDEEKRRLEKEAAEEKDLLPRVERVLVGLDRSAGAQLAARLSGWLLGARELTATVIRIDPQNDRQPEPVAPAEEVLAAADSAALLCKPAPPQPKSAKDEPGAPVVDRPDMRKLISSLSVKESAEAAPDARAQLILTEAQKGYGLLFLGLDPGPNPATSGLSPVLEKIVREFTGPVAILVDATPRPAPAATLRRILVPTTGTNYSRLGAEVAVAIAKGCGASITALHVSVPPTDNELLRRPQELLRNGRTLISDIVALGNREGVRVVSRSVLGPAKESAILRHAWQAGYDLIVIGTKASSSEQLRFGRSTEALLENAPCPILLVTS